MLKDTDEQFDDSFYTDEGSYFIKQNNVDTCDGGVPNRNRLFLNCQTFKSYSKTITG